MKALSLDMGGTHITCAIVEDREILVSHTIEITQAHMLAPLLNILEATILKLFQRANVTTGECAGCAIGFPGIIDIEKGHILSTVKKYEDAAEIDLSDWVLSRFNLTLRMDNDARLAILGEQYAGAGQGEENIVMMTLGTGIGTAVIMEGRLLRGAHSQAGCLGGHLTVDIHGRACVCGNLGCAEAEAAGSSLPNIAQRWDNISHSSIHSSSPLNFRNIFAAAAMGDLAAQEIQQHCLRVWSATAVNLIHAYDPSLVLMGGGIMQSAHVILPFVERYISMHAWRGKHTVKIRAASLGSNAALLGAVPLLHEAAVSNRTFTM